MFITELNLYINYLKEQLENDFRDNQLTERKNIMFLLLKIWKRASRTITGCRA